MLNKKRKNPNGIHITIQNLTLSKIKSTKEPTAYIIDGTYSGPKEYFPGLEITEAKKTSELTEKKKLKIRRLRGKRFITGF